MRAWGLISDSVSTKYRISEYIYCWLLSKAAKYIPSVTLSPTTIWHVLTEIMA